MKCLNAKGYPDWTVFEVWVDAPPLHSLRLTVEDQQQTAGLRLHGEEKANKHWGQNEGVVNIHLKPEVHIHQIKKIK